MHSNLERSRECSLYCPCGSTVETGSCSNSRRRTGRTLVETFPEEAYLWLPPNFVVGTFSSGSLQDCPGRILLYYSFLSHRDFKLTRSAATSLRSKGETCHTRRVRGSGGGASRPRSRASSAPHSELASGREQRLRALYVSFCRPFAFSVLRGGLALYATESPRRHEIFLTRCP